MLSAFSTCRSTHLYRRRFSTLCLQLQHKFQIQVQRQSYHNQSTLCVYCQQSQRREMIPQDSFHKHFGELLHSGCRSMHTGSVLLKKKKEISSEPIKFTTSPANVRSMPEPAETNEYQGIIIAASLFVFLSYFLYLREENDLDEQLNVHLFDRVPNLEEPHLAQAIPRMKELGLDTTEAEKRLKDLVQERLKREAEEKTAKK